MVPGFAPPLFEKAARDAVEVPGDVTSKRLKGLSDSLEDKASKRHRASLRLRRAFARKLTAQIYDSYRIPNARGDVRRLSDFFAPKAPPGGTGDCAAPKLLAQAFHLGLTPLALAEFWWGAPPPAGGRVAGSYYPACKPKCGVLLPFMMEGLNVSPPRLFEPAPFRGEGLKVLFEDDALVVLEKPVGLLSVPGRGGARHDSVLTRMRDASKYGPKFQLVHRLDLETSGLLLGARDVGAYVELQRLFLGRDIEKRYVAWVEGEVVADEGIITLRLRGDVDDRPRQIHDPMEGKDARTAWRVLERKSGRTKIEFVPHTGRTHQLRVHAAHPLGLGAPIVGDRLYGHVGDRLLLHAERLRFVHPRTGQRVTFESPAPF